MVLYRPYKCFCFLYVETNFLEKENEAKTNFVPLLEPNLIFALKFNDFFSVRLVAVYALLYTYSMNIGYSS